MGWDTQILRWALLLGLDGCCDTEIGLVGLLSLDTRSTGILNAATRSNIYSIASWPVWLVGAARIYTLGS